MAADSVNQVNTAETQMLAARVPRTHIKVIKRYALDNDVSVQEAVKEAIEALARANDLPIPAPRAPRDQERRTA